MIYFVLLPTEISHLLVESQTRYYYTTWRIHQGTEASLLIDAVISSFKIYTLQTIYRLICGRLTRLFFCQSVCLFACLTLPVCFFVYLSVCLSVCLSIHPFVFLSVCLSVSLCARLSVSPSVCLSVSLSGRLPVSVWLSLCLAACLSLSGCFSVCPSVCLFLCLSVCLFGYFLFQSICQYGLQTTEICRT